MSGAPLLRAEHLVKHFPSKKGLFRGATSWVRAVDGVSLDVGDGENVAIVGESGCGKTTLGRMLAGIIKPTSGTVEYGGVPLAKIGHLEISRTVQPVFQDPVGALNPVSTVKSILARPFKIHHMKFDEGRLVRLLDEVGLSPGRSFLKRLPFELSGGQRQRVVIARALALEPKLIIADEPVSGLDPTVQTQILALLRRIQRSKTTAFLVISHDINLVRAVATRTIVMYLGKVVEFGPTKEILEHPVHPYTVSLLKSFPSGNPKDTSWVDSPPLRGDIPSAVNPPSGCRFRTRCQLAIDECAAREPVLTECGKDHFAACPVVLAQSAPRGGGDRERRSS